MKQTQMMNILVNGVPHELPAGTCLQTLIDQLQLTGKRYAVEVNKEIVPRSEHADYVLNDGDKVEIVQAIGGG